jgi:hypothetical protein
VARDIGHTATRISEFHIRELTRMPGAGPTRRFAGGWARRQQKRRRVTRRFERRQDAGPGRDRACARRRSARGRRILSQVVYTAARARGMAGWRDLGRRCFPALARRCAPDLASAALLFGVASAGARACRSAIDAFRFGADTPSQVAGGQARCDRQRAPGSRRRSGGFGACHRGAAPAQVRPRPRVVGFVFGRSSSWPAARPSGRSRIPGPCPHRASLNGPRVNPRYECSRASTKRGHAGRSQPHSPASRPPKSR